MIAALALPQELRDRIEQEARAAFPRECCGLIEGRREGEVSHALAVHPVRNLSRDRDRFEIDPAEHFRLLRKLRGTSREILGCYHSHPNGRAALSPRDRENGSSDGFVWLVVAFGGQRSATGWSCHVANEGAWHEIELRIAQEVPCG